MDVQIKSYDPARRSEVLELVRLGLGDKPGLARDAAWWAWRHEANPFGRSLILTAESDGRIVGVRPFLRWKLSCGGRVLNAVKPIDTVTHPEFQRRGIFSRLTRAAIEQAVNENVDLLFNTPNHNSLPGYLKLGWQRAARLPLYVKLLRPASAAVRAVRSILGRVPNASTPGTPPFAVHSRPADTVRDELDAIAALDSGEWRNGDLFTPRSPEFLRWRYLENPQTRYYVEIERTGGDVAAALFFRTRLRGQLREIMLDDLFVREQQPEPAARLIERLRANAEADYIVAHFPASLPLLPTLQRLGFHRVPGRQIELVSRSVRDGEGSMRVAEQPWALTFGDIEGL